MASHCWSLNPEQPRLSDYPTQPATTQNLPELESLLQTIGEYQRRLWAHRQRGLLLVVHGSDAAGKDSLIRTLATYIDPAGFKAWSFSRPEGPETRHDFLWRVTPRLPAFGEVVAFNRSYHEAVIAERAWPIWRPDAYDWAARYAAIRQFEQHLVSEGTSLVKFWLNLSPEEHRKRLLERLDKPHKQWKFDASDIDAWHRRDELQAYAEEAMAATHTPQAPWLIVPGDDKPTARRIVANTLAETLKTLAPDYPAADTALLATYRRELTEGDNY